MQNAFDHVFHSIDIPPSQSRILNAREKVPYRALESTLQRHNHNSATASLTHKPIPAHQPVEQSLFVVFETETGLVSCAHRV